MSIFLTRTRLPRDHQTQLQASADEFHISFVLGAACTLAGILVDLFLLGHPEAAKSIPTVSPEPLAM